MKIRPVPSEFSMRTDGQTNITNITDAFRSLANATTNSIVTFMKLIFLHAWCVFSLSVAQ